VVVGEPGAQGMRPASEVKQKEIEIEKIADAVPLSLSVSAANEYLYLFRRQGKET
jgi:hypothetical protein